MDSLYKWNNKGHQFDDIAYKLKDKKHIYLYGAGAVANDILNIIEGSREWLKWQIEFVDMDVRKQNSGYNGYHVLSPEEFFGRDKEDYFVVVCAVGKGQKEILEGLAKQGVKEDDIFIFDYFMFTYLPIHFVYNHDIVFFATESLIPSTLCNLNCKSCLNFNPYIKKHITDEFETVKEDIDLFFEKVDLIYRFQISGGEPLLYKHLGQLITYIAENYSKQIIRFELVTNGTIEPSVEICTLLSRYDVTVFLDDYRDSVAGADVKFELAKKRFEELDVKYIHNYVEKWFRIYPSVNVNPNMTDSELQEYYASCGSPFSTLRNKRISSCNYAHYAAKAGIEDNHEDEYFELDKVNSNNKKEFIEFRLRYNDKGYMEFCKKCDGWSNINDRIEKAAIQVEHEK